MKTAEKTEYLSINQDVGSINLYTPDGGYVIGFFPALSESQPFFSIKMHGIEKGFRCPTLGGIINFKNQDTGFMIKGSFKPNGIFKGSVTYPNGDYLKGLFDLDRNGSLFFTSGLQKMTYTDGSILEGEWKKDEVEGTCTYPNGDYQKGLFRLDRNKSIIFMFGIERMNLPDGSILEGENSGSVFTGTRTSPNGESTNVIT